MRAPLFSAFWIISNEDTTSDTNPKRVSRRLTLVGLPSCIVERLVWEWTFTPRYYAMALQLTPPHLRGNPVFNTLINRKPLDYPYYSYAIIPAKCSSCNRGGPSWSHFLPRHHIVPHGRDADPLETMYGFHSVSVTQFMVYFA